MEEKLRNAGFRGEYTILGISDELIKRGWNQELHNKSLATVPKNPTPKEFLANLLLTYIT